jgi:dCMP deaminase
MVNGMISNPRLLETYLDVAYSFSQLSYAKRLQVGCVMVKHDRIISIGYNGTPSGWSNRCENTIIDIKTGKEVLVTRPEVLHAESNAIAKLARSTESGEGASLICTHAPCLDCSKLIYQSGITQVLYQFLYKNEDGLEFLKKSGIEVIQISGAGY